MPIIMSHEVSKAVLEPLSTKDSPPWKALIVDTLNFS